MFIKKERLEILEAEVRRLREQVYELQKSTIFEVGAIPDGPDVSPLVHFFAQSIPINQALRMLLNWNGVEIVTEQGFKIIDKKEGK